MLYFSLGGSFDCFVYLLSPFQKIGASWEEDSIDQWVSFIAPWMGPWSGGSSRVVVDLIGMSGVVRAGWGLCFWFTVHCSTQIVYLCYREFCFLLNRYVTASFPACGGADPGDHPNFFFEVKWSLSETFGQYYFFPLFQPFIPKDRDIFTGRLRRLSVAILPLLTTTGSTSKGITHRMAFLPILLATNIGPEPTTIYLRQRSTSRDSVTTEDQ